MNARSLHISRPMVYIVDDEQAMLDLAEAALLRIGCQVKKFLNPAEAYESLLREPTKPAVLLTDFAMVPVDGVEFSKLCKEAHPKLRILMVSGTIEPEAATTAPAIDGFLGKPYRLDDLAARVDRMIKEAGSNETGSLESMGTGH